MPKELQDTESNDGYDSEEHQPVKVKKEKGKKKKKSYQDDDEKYNQTQDQSIKENDKDDLDESQANKKKAKKNKKKSPKQQEAETNDIENEISNIEPEEIEEEKPKKKDKKRKTKETTKFTATEGNESEEEKESYGKNKKKSKKFSKDQLEKMARDKQEKLVNLGNELMNELSNQLLELFDGEKKELFEEAIAEAVQYYEDNIDDASNFDVFNEKKASIQNVWNELLELMKLEYKELHKEDEAEKTQKRLERERQRKIEQFKAMGVSIGPKQHQNDNHAKQNQSNNKKLERQKLKELKEKLKKEEEDKKKELENAQKKIEEENKKQEEIRRKQEEEEKKEQEQLKNDEWSDASDNDNSDFDNNTNKQRGKKPNPPKIYESSDGFGGTVPNKPSKANVDSWSDASDDESNKPKVSKATQPKKQPNSKQPPSSKELNSPKESPSPKEPEVSNIQVAKKKENKNKKSKNIESKGEILKQGKEIKDDSNNVNTETKNKKSKKPSNKKDDPEIKEDPIPNKKQPLRAPICVVMGHVDTGKTKILDKIRSTNVQEREVGGITQQIGATFLSIDYIKSATEKLKEQLQKIKYRLPGLLFIDTPGHESFSNLRKRGSSLCDIAVLVVDLMHGVEPQTVESLKMLRERGAPFVVAVNKIDRLLDWKAQPNSPFLKTLETQKLHTKKEFETRISSTKLQLAEQGWNTELYYSNKTLRKPLSEQDISLVPTSAITGEGIPDLLYLLVQLTQRYMDEKLIYDANAFTCTILEVKKTEGHGHTLDVILSNGTLKKDDQICVCGMNGPIITYVKALLLPHEAQEMRVKGEYTTVNEVHASSGVRVAAKDLEYAVAGSHLLLVPRDLSTKNKDIKKQQEIIEQLKDEVQKDYADILKHVSRHNRGVYVQASTLGSLEALITYLHSMKVPISGISIGDVHKQDVMRAGVMLEHQREYAVILAFNVKTQQDAQLIADEMGVKIFTAEIIYHLFDMFTNYLNEIKEAKKSQAKDIAVFPVELEILSEHIIRNKNPFLFGCLVRRGTLRIGTPLVAKKYNNDGTPTPLLIGKVMSIQQDNKDKPYGVKGEKYAVKIEADPTAVTYQYGRQFNSDQKLVSHITRNSLDAIKIHFKDDLEEDDIKHLHELKQYFNVI